MMRRRSTTHAAVLPRMLCVALAGVLCLAPAACTGATDDSSPTTTGKAGAHSGPDLADVDDAASLVDALESYDGPYRVEAEVDFAGLHEETTTFDGENWARVVDPGSPIEEFRWISDGKTASCYQRDDDTWVSGGGSPDDGERRLASNFDNWTTSRYIDGVTERSVDEVLRFEPTSDGFALVVVTPAADSLTRVELVVEDGALTGARLFMTDGSLHSTQKISYPDVDEISAPKGAEDGIDVIC